MRNCPTYTELNKVHNVQCFQCFDELLYQECNVSITPFPGAVTMSPVNAGNTVSVQVLSTPDEEPWSPVISLICLAPSVTLSDKSWVKEQPSPPKNQVKILLSAKKGNILKHFENLIQGSDTVILENLIKTIDTKYN